MRKCRSGVEYVEFEDFLGEDEEGDRGSVVFLKERRMDIFGDGRFLVGC